MDDHKSCRHDSFVKDWSFVGPALRDVRSDLYLLKQILWQGNTEHAGLILGMAIGRVDDALRLVKE